MMSALPTAPLSFRLFGAVGGAVDNATPQGSTYLRGISVQSIGASSDRSLIVQPNVL